MHELSGGSPALSIVKARPDAEHSVRALQETFVNRQPPATLSTFIERRQGKPESSGLAAGFARRVAA